MIKKHSKLFSVLLALALLACVVGGYFYFKNEAYKKELSQFHYWIPEKKIEAQIVEDGKAAFVTERYDKQIIEELKIARKVTSFLDLETYDVQSGTKHLVTMEARLKKAPFKNYESDNSQILQRNKAEKGEYWKLHIYTIEGEKLSKKTLDIFQITQEYNKKHGTDYVPSIVGDAIRYNGQQEAVGIVFREKNKGSSESTLIRYLIDLNTGKVVDKDVNLYKKNLQITRPFIANTSLDKQFESQGINVTGYGVELKKGVTKKEVESWQFGQKYPKLVSPLLDNRDYKSDDQPSTDPLSSLYILQLGEDIETSSQVISLFYPKGTNIFENVTIPAKYSVDNQEHVVHSYDEFIRYYDKNTSIYTSE